MTLTDGIRKRLKAGQTVEQIVIELGVPARAVRKIQWELRNPDYKKIYMRHWRARSGADKRYALRRALEKWNERQIEHAERVMSAIQGGGYDFSARAVRTAITNSIYPAIDREGDLCCSGFS